jgi:hypothetical protein
LLLTPIIGEFRSDIELVAAWATDHSDFCPLNEITVGRLLWIRNEILCACALHFFCGSHACKHD